MSERQVPQNITAEESLLGAMLLSRTAIETAGKIVTAADFYKPSHAAIFVAIDRLYQDGMEVDPVTVAAQLHETGMLESIGGPSRLIELQAGTPATSSAGRYAHIIAEHAGLRMLISICDEAKESAYGMDGAAGVLADELAARLVEVTEARSTDDPLDLSTIDEFLDRPQEARPPWAIPGLARVGWRVMIVAGEGVGKTVLLRQIGIAASQGIHPLHFGPIPPVRVLVVDLENPDDSVQDVCEPLRRKVQRQVSGEDYDGDRMWLWHRPGGIDLRSRRDRQEFEAVVARVQPDLVVMGPIYKAYSVAANESDELAAREVMKCFDDLRTRYQFALILEHHAPKGSGSARKMDPYGTSLWLRWPEIGLGLVAKEPNNQTLSLDRWRGDRMENSWPVEIRRGGPGNWMWEGVWPAGTFTAPGEVKVPTTSDVREPMTVNASTGEISREWDPEF